MIETQLNDIYVQKMGAMNLEKLNEILMAITDLQISYRYLLAKRIGLVSDLHQSFLKRLGDLQLDLVIAGKEMILNS